MSDGLLNASLVETVGAAGAGTMAQSGGSNTTGVLQVGAFGGTGTYMLSGGTLSARELEIVFGGGGPLLAGFGSFSVQNAVANFSGLVINNGTISLLGPSATASAGELHDTGNAQLLDSPTATIDIGIGGLGAGVGYGSLQFAAHAICAGTLNVTLTNGFSPSPGESFDIVQAGMVFNFFTSVTLPGGPGTFDGETYSNGLYTLAYTSNDVVVTYLPEPSGAIFAGGALLPFCRRRKRRGQPYLPASAFKSVNSS